MICNIYVTTGKFSPAGIDSVTENICSILSTFSKPFPLPPEKDKTTQTNARLCIVQGSTLFNCSIYASFYSCTNKKAVAENVYEVNQELGPWGIVFFCVPGSSLRGSPLPLSTPATQASPGVGNRPPRKKKIAIPRGARLQVKLNLDFLKG